MSVSRNKNSQVILGAHSITKRESEKQIMYIKKEFPYPCFDPHTHEGDLKLLQVCTSDRLHSHRTSHHLADFMEVFSLVLCGYRQELHNGVLEGGARI